MTRPVSLSSEGLTSSIHCHADALLSNFASSILHSKRMSRIKNQFLWCFWVSARSERSSIHLLLSHKKFTQSTDMCFLQRMREREKETFFPKINFTQLYWMRFQVKFYWSRELLASEIRFDRDVKWGRKAEFINNVVSNQQGIVVRWRKKLLSFVAKVLISSGSKEYINEDTSLSQSGNISLNLWMIPNNWTPKQRTLRCFFKQNVREIYSFSLSDSQSGL